MSVILNQYPASKSADLDLFSLIASDLESTGFSIQCNAIPHEVTLDLKHQLTTIEKSDFAPAKVGRGDNSEHVRFIRTNKIHWMDNSIDSPWYQWTELVKSELNRLLFLGLTTFESHFTRYETGDFYKRHIDSFKGERNRILSLVTFLNTGWLPDQGGQLVIYHDDGSSTSVTPEAGTLVLFLSEEVPHEVLTANRTRPGGAGWYRVNEPHRQSREVGLTSAHSD